MDYPLGVVTRTITVGDSLAVESGTDLTVRATLRSSRGLVWVATGERAVSAPEVRGGRSHTAGRRTSPRRPATHPSQAPRARRGSSAWSPAMGPWSGPSD